MKKRTKQTNLGGRPPGSTNKPDGVDVLTASQAAEVAGVGVERITNAINGGGLVGASLGHGLGPRTTKRAVLDWIENGCPENDPDAPKMIRTPTSED